MKDRSQKVLDSFGKRAPVWCTNLFPLRYIVPLNATRGLEPTFFMSAQSVTRLAGFYSAFSTAGMLAVATLLTPLWQPAAAMPLETKHWCRFGMMAPSAVVNWRL